MWRFGALAAVAACDDNVFGVAETEATGPEEVPGTLDSVNGIFEDNCYACHSSAPAGNTLDLQTNLLVSTLDVPSSYEGIPLLTAGDPDNSALFLKIVGDERVGSLMPPGAPLPNSQVDAIEQWILDLTPSTPPATSR